MFNVEHGLIVFFDRGATFFTRMVKLPFPPYIGLTLNSDAAGSYNLERVGWLDKHEMFITQGTVIRREWKLTQAVRRLEKVGWKEEPKARSFTGAPRKESKAKQPTRTSASPQE